MKRNTDSKLLFLGKTIIRSFLDNNEYHKCSIFQRLNVEASIRYGVFSRTSVGSF